MNALQGRILLVLVGAAGVLTASFFIAHALTCDYDVAGLVLHLDRGGPAREFVPVTRLLLGPTVAGAGHLASAFIGSTPFITTWQFIVGACVGVAWALVFAACWRLTGSRRAAAAGTLLFGLSGASAYLTRVLEDNLVTTVWLAAIVWLLAPHRERPPGTRRFAAAGLAWGAALLYGVFAASWIVFLAAAAWCLADGWPARLRHAAVAAGCGLALFLSVTTFVTPRWIPAPVNPLSRFADGVPNAAMFQTAHSPAVRIRYVLLGTYHSLFALPADAGSEWGTAYGRIAAGRYPGIGRHLATAGGVLVLLAGVCWRRTRRVPAMQFGRACVVAACGLTSLNLTAIDGAFLERFDYLPLLLAPAAAVAIADRPRRLVRGAAIGLVIAVAVTTLAYAARVATTDATLWSFADARALAEIRRPAEPVIVDAAVGVQYDMDPVSLNFGLWLGRTHTVLIPAADAPYEGYYAIRPQARLIADEPRRAWFEALLRLHQSVLMNDVALASVRAMFDDRWSITEVHRGRFTYWRAERP